jgi:ribosomal 30S subunit maturation factor RimM
MLVEDELEEGEWLADDLVGLEVPGMGRVARLMDAPSCTVLELDDGTLVPLVSDAIERIDVDAGEIHVNRDFLG